MMSSSFIALKKADSVPALPLCSTDSWHMPDVCPAASSLLDLEAVFCGEPPSFCEIGLPGITGGLLHKSGYIPGPFFDHGSPQILIFSINPRSSVLDRAALAALVELRKKPPGVFAILEVGGIESRPIVVSDKAAMVYEVLIEPVGKILRAKTVLKEPDPGFEHQGLLTCAQKLRIAKRVLLHKIRNGAA